MLENSGENSGDIIPVNFPLPPRTVRRQLDFKLLKLNMMRKRQLDLDDFPEYRDKVMDRLGGEFRGQYT